MSLTLPLSVFAATWYLVAPGGRTSVMLPLLVFTPDVARDAGEHDLDVAVAGGGGDVAVAMPVPLMLPLLVFAVIVVDVTPSAWMFAVAGRGGQRGRPDGAHLRCCRCSVFRVSGPDAWPTDRLPSPVERLTGPVVPVTVASPAPLFAVSVVTVAGTVAVASSSQSPNGIGQW